MSKEVKFVDGLRAFKPHQAAPSFVIAALEINTADLMTWLNSQGDKVRLDLKESKSGTYYCSVNDFVPKPKPADNGPPDFVNSRPKDNGPERDNPPPADDFDDDIPFN